MPNSDLAIQVSDLRKYYDLGEVRVEALRGVNMKVRKGEYISIVGPSGSGKSTLLNLLGALDRPTAGEILIDGIDISRLNGTSLARFRNRKIGFVFQSYNLVNRMTVLENLQLPTYVNPHPVGERAERAMSLLGLVGLGDKARRKPTVLSGGEQQRVAIARALVNEPAFILADEPTGNLDSKTAHTIENLLRTVSEQEKTTVVLVTHNLELANQTDRILHIRDGVIEKETVL